MGGRAGKGAAAELIAGAYLIGKGYDVFYPAHVFGPFDLVAYDGKSFFRVEVKTVTHASYTAQSVLYSKPKNEFDILIVVGLNGECHEFLPDSDYYDNVNKIRAHYGWEPVVRRINR